MAKAKAKVPAPKPKVDAGEALQKIEDILLGGLERAGDHFMMHHRHHSRFLESVQKLKEDHS